MRGRNIDSFRMSFGVSYGDLIPLSSLKAKSEDKNKENENTLSFRNVVLENGSTSLLPLI